MVRQCNIVLDDGKWLVYGLDKDMASCCNKNADDGQSIGADIVTHANGGTTLLST